ncbi:MAG: GNAT family N-acetyltransferase [Rectinema sp.]|jgi:GNAT superfamily N-acetyltransferase|uniref:GCN5-related N-acetyltransferase n=1 Tax=uncultured spirochete TaxID=156406 RepID=A0A3P3XS60_9SPIR|nr:GCN5-related N-acetyltransferase [uncultured spirochete]
MKVEISDINFTSFADLFSPCNRCIYWEAPEQFGGNEHARRSLSGKEALGIKKAWFKKTQEIFGRCGLILYAEGETVGYAQYAPPALLPNVGGYAQSIAPPSQDAALISCLYIRAEYQRQGLGKMLLQRVTGDIQEKGYRAAETYARDDSPDNCSGPTAFYLSNGFTLLKTKKWEQATFSLLRLDLTE